MKNTIKLTSILLLAALIICPFLLTDNVRVAFGVDLTKLSENSTSLQSMVRDKLNTESYTLETLYGVDGEGRYTLVEGDNCYLIYYNEQGDYMEYSTESNSVYFGMESGVKKVYAGPTYYMYEKGGHYYDLENDEQLTETQLSERIQMETDMLNDYAEDVEIEKSRANTQMKSTSELPESYEIEHGYYFENLKDNKHYNNDGSCGYVALEMLLSYYDTFYNDNIIDDNKGYDVVAVHNYADGTTLDKINPVDYEESPGYTDEFHNSLLHLGRTNLLTPINKSTLTSTGIMRLTYCYFSSRKIDINITYTDTKAAKFCRQALYDNKPIVVGINTSSDGHFAVAYGYNETGIYVHYGWPPIYSTNININYSAIQWKPFYINFKSGASCSNNYHWTIGGCSGTYCPHCKTNQVVEHGKKYKWFSNTHHNVTCGCRTFNLVKEGHAVSGTGSKKRCLLCGGTVDMGFVQIDSVGGLLRSANGSYMLPNGIVVLQDADINDYINGTLKFYNNDLMIA